MCFKLVPDSYAIIRIKKKWTSGQSFLIIHTLSPNPPVLIILILMCKKKKKIMCTKVINLIYQHILHLGIRRVTQFFNSKRQFQNVNAINGDWQGKVILEVSFKLQIFVIYLKSHSHNINKIYIHWTRKEIMGLYYIFQLYGHHFIIPLKTEIQKYLRPPSLDYSSPS